MQAIISGVQSISDDNGRVRYFGGVRAMSTAPYLLTKRTLGMRLHTTCV